MLILPLASHFTRSAWLRARGRRGIPATLSPPGLLPAFGPLPTCGSSCCFCPSRPPAPQQYAWYGTHTHLRGDSAVRALSHVTDDIARRVLPRPGVTVPRSALRRKLLSEEKGLECLSANGLVQPPVGKLRRAGGSHLPPSSAVAQVCLGTIRDRQDAWTPSKPDTQPVGHRARPSATALTPFAHELGPSGTSYVPPPLTKVCKCHLPQWLTRLRGAHIL